MPQPLHRPARTLRRRVLLAALPLVVALALTLSLPARPAAAAIAQTSALAFGQSATVGGCMTLTVQNYRDRSGDLENYDWVTVVLQNQCPHAVGSVLVELYLVSVNGELYGRRFWALEPTMGLMPSGTFKERWAIPDPDSYTAAAWAMRILEAKRKTPR